MVLGFGKKKQKTENPGRIKELERRVSEVCLENLKMKSRLAEADKLKEKYEKLQGEHSNLKRETRSIFKTAEAQVKKEVGEVKKELESKYQTKIADLEEERKTLNLELGRKLDELKDYKKQTSEENTKLKAEIIQLRQTTEEKEKEHQQYVDGLPKIEEKIAEIAKKKRYELLSEGSIVTATIFGKLKEERRETMYEAIGPNGEIFTLRSSRTYVNGEDVEVIVKSLPRAEVRILDHPDIDLKVGNVIENLVNYDRTNEGMSVICNGGRELIINIGEHVSKMGDGTKIKVLEERDGKFYGERI